jgi:hypothetical protein
VNGYFGVLQALKLAEYKPVIDVKNLPESLQRVEEMASDAQRFYKNTRIKIVYYEDLVMHPEVSFSDFFHWSCYVGSHKYQVAIKPGVSNFCSFPTCSV